MPLTPTQTEAELRRLARKLEERTDALAEVLQAAAEADVEYQVNYARAILVSNEKTVSRQEADATVRCEDLLWKRKTTEAVANAAKASVNSLRDQIDAVRSINSNVRHAAGLDR
jgi:hypothetical protein